MPEENSNLSSNPSSGLIPVNDYLFQATTARGFEVGQEIFGRYKLIRVLGRGGMGIVWLAFDKQLEQDVAIKVLPDLVMHDREALRDMKSETKRSLQLNHHNIVRIYDFNQDDKGAGISMEFVDGETLSSAKSERPEGCFSPDELAPWLEQICEALSYAHHVAKIVHRDLKPANIMITKTGVVKVTDFGIARSISDSVSRVSMRHASSGTMVFMSPQQSSGATPSPSDDIYALGSTIYDLMTGKPPFFSGNIQHQLENITPPRMSDRRAELGRSGPPIPETWEKAVAACLEKEVSRRPASIKELALLLGLRNSSSMQTVSATEFSAKTAASTSGNPTATVPVTAQIIAPIPPPPPHPPFLSPSLWKWAAIGVGSMAVLIATLLLTAFIIGQGDVSIRTDPSGALVAFNGITSTSPATFKNIWSGDKQVAVRLDGFDPLQMPLHVTKNLVNDPGVITLKRSTGQLSLFSIPPDSNYSITLQQSPVPTESVGGEPLARGKYPYLSSALPTGKYSIMTHSNLFPDNTQSIEIKPNDKLKIVIDLVKENVLQSLDPQIQEAIRQGQPLSDQLLHDANGRPKLISYYQTTEQDYLQIRQFKLAAEQLNHLSKDLGVDTTEASRHLDETQDAWLEEIKKNVQALEASKRYLSAENLLDDEDARSTRIASENLREDIKKAKADHDQKIFKAMADITALQNAGKNDEAYQLAQTVSEHETEEPQLIQELATLELGLPSLFTRVDKRSKSMDALLSIDPDLVENNDFTRLRKIFQTNLDQHNDLKARISKLESAIDEYDSRIGSLRAEIKHNQAKSTGYKTLGVLGFLGGIAGAANNSTPGAVAGFGSSVVGAKGAADRDADIRSLQSQIDSIKSEKAPKEEELDQLKKQYEKLTKTPIGEVVPPDTSIIQK